MGTVRLRLLALSDGTPVDFPCPVELQLPDLGRTRMRRMRTETRMETHGRRTFVIFFRNTEPPNKDPMNTPLEVSVERRECLCRVVRKVKYQVDPHPL